MRLHFRRSPVSPRNWSTSDRQRESDRRPRARRQRGERAARRAQACRSTPASPSWSCCASPTARSRGRGHDRDRAHGWRTSRARRRSPRSTRTRGASACIRCRRSRTGAAPSSSTAPGRQSRARATSRATSAAWLAETLGLRPFALDDERRALYHAGAAIASNYLVTLRRAAGSLLEAAGAPPEALDPLMRRVIENDFELTGAIERGDWATVEPPPRCDPRRAARAGGAVPALAGLTASQIGVEVPA